MGQSWLVWSLPGLMDRYELSTGDFQPDKFLPFELHRRQVIEAGMVADAVEEDLDVGEDVGPVAVAGEFIELGLLEPIGAWQS